MSLFQQHNLVHDLIMKMLRTQPPTVTKQEDSCKAENIVSMMLTDLLENLHVTKDENSKEKKRRKRKRKARTKNDSDDSGHESDPMSCEESGCIPKDESHVTNKCLRMLKTSQCLEGTSGSHSAGNRMSAHIGTGKQKKAVSPINAKQQECEKFLDRSVNDNISNSNNNNNNKNIKEAGRNLKEKVVMALYNFKVGDNYRYNYGYGQVPNE